MTDIYKFEVGLLGTNCYLVTTDDAPGSDWSDRRDLDRTGRQADRSMAGSFGRNESGGMADSGRHDGSSRRAEDAGPDTNMGQNEISRPGINVGQARGVGQNENIGQTECAVRAGNSGQMGRSGQNGNKLGMLIDPGYDGEFLEEQLCRLGVRLVKIVLTHGHFDHIGAVRYLKEKFNPEVSIHEEDAAALTDPGFNYSSLMLRRSIVQLPPDRLLKDGDIIRLGRLEFRVLHTPGHTPGGICILGEDVLFTGDTLFAGSVGRWDLGGDPRALILSIQEKILTLEDHIRVLPGHGPETTIGKERRTNPYMS